jgi:hypothetical protein
MPLPTHALSESPQVLGTEGILMFALTYSPIIGD